MVSKYEVLEYLRIKGGACLLSELCRVLGPNTITRVHILKETGLVDTKYVDVLSKRGKKVKRVLVKLTKTAYNILREHNVESFYDLPMAKAREQWLMQTMGRSFKRFDKI